MIGEYCLCNDKQINAFKTLSRLCHTGGLHVFIDPMAGSSELDLLVCAMGENLSIPITINFDKLEAVGVSYEDAIESASSLIVAYFGKGRWKPGVV